MATRKTPKKKTKPSRPLTHERRLELLLSASLVTQAVQVKALVQLLYLETTPPESRTTESLKAFTAPIFEKTGASVLETLRRVRESQEMESPELKDLAEEPGEALADAIWARSPWGTKD